MLYIYAACHEKTDLKVFVLVIPKEGLVGWGFVLVIPKEGLAGWGPGNPSLGMTPTIKLYSAAITDYIM